MKDQVVFSEALPLPTRFELQSADLHIWGLKKSKAIAHTGLLVF